MRFLKDGSRKERARKAAIKVPWILIGFQIALAATAVTAAYALVYQWDPPSRIGFGMILFHALGTALLSGLVSALLDTSMTKLDTVTTYLDEQGRLVNTSNDSVNHISSAWSRLPKEAGTSRTHSRVSHSFRTTTRTTSGSSPKR